MTKQWEYKTLRGIGWNAPDLSDDVKNELNVQGKNGWELIAVTQTIFWFKREIEIPEIPEIVGIYGKLGACLACNGYGSIHSNECQKSKEINKPTYNVTIDE